MDYTAVVWDSCPKAHLNSFERAQLSSVNNSLLELSYLLEQCFPIGDWLADTCVVPRAGKAAAPLVLHPWWWSPSLVVVTLLGGGPPNCRLIFSCPSLLVHRTLCEAFLLLPFHAASLDVG